MRTNTQGFVQQIRNAVRPAARQYQVSVTIFFVMSSSNIEPDFGTLREAIVETDRRFPWKDKNPSTGEDFKSIRYLSNGENKIDNWQVPVKTCYFAICPGMDRLRQGQLHAYENYLAQIAEALAKLKLPNVTKVRCVVETRRSFEALS